jgi:hypothetical protein
MTSEKVFDIWAPREGIWSAWVKPVAFANMTRVSDTAVAERPQQAALPLQAADQTTMLVIDMPGSNGVWMGLAAAEKGYRPIPLYNAVPGPGAGISLVDVRPIFRTMAEVAPLLAGMNLRDDAPPAFLLDRNRRTGLIAASAGRFDNRSISFPTDFPGANLLKNRGISSAILIQEGTAVDPQSDLSHTLRRWQEAKIALNAIALGLGNEMRTLDVRTPPWFRSIWHRVAISFGLRRNPLGGFGGILPDMSNSG